MRLTPLDIRKQEFKKGMRGLDSDEVYAFLATIADEYEAVLNDNKALRERLLELDDKVQEYRNMEKTLRDTLLTAERITVEAKDSARREAELIIKQAELDADKGSRDIKASASRLRQEIQQLKRQRESFMERMKGLVESHLKFLQSAEEDFREEEKMLEREVSQEQGSRLASDDELSRKRSPVLPRAGATLPRREEPFASPKIDRPLPAGPLPAGGAPPRPAERPRPDLEATSSSRLTVADSPAEPKVESSRIFERHAVEMEREAPLPTPVAPSTERAPKPPAPVATAEAMPPSNGPGESDESTNTSEWSLERLKRDILGRWRNHDDSR
jgi:cell division initiation protein